MALEPFSKRNRYSAAGDITIRESAPENLRYFVLRSAYDCHCSPLGLLQTLCKLLRVVPQSNEAYEYQVEAEVKDLLYACDWFKVYDFIEFVHSGIADRERYSGYDHNAERFAESINGFFVDEGIGWQLADGQIATRGTEEFEAVVTHCIETLRVTERETAARHMHEALQDLSRRPHADLPGAIYHALGALECVARDVAGDAKATLGEVIKQHPGLLPKPLEDAVPKIWGYASNEARHVLEGRAVNREEAEMLVGLSAVLTTYLARKFRSEET